jgi:hypothetical protein
LYDLSVKVLLRGPDRGRVVLTSGRTDAALALSSLMALSVISRVSWLHPQCRTCGRWYFARKPNQKECSKECSERHWKDYFKTKMAERRKEQKENGYKTDPKAEARLNEAERREARRRNAVAED